METYLQGIGVSPGIALAAALRFSHDAYDVPQYTITDLAAEQRRLNEAIEATRSDLNSIYNHTVEGLGKTHAEIFRAHIMILDDVALREDIAHQLEIEQYNVEFILHNLAKRYVQAMSQIDDPRFRERTADMLDVVDRLLRHLLAAERPNLRHLERASVIIARDLTPSDTASMDITKAIGLAVEAGSVTSHSAILARALEIPAVVGIPNVFETVPAGATVIVDGTAGQVIVNPEAATIARYEKARHTLALRQRKLLKTSVKGPALTSDGVEVELCANIELPFEIEHSLRVNAHGIGLYRTEYLFINRDTLPNEEEQYESYAHVVRSLAPLPVTLRTIDIGGDKFIAHLQMLKEDNPQLGWRAVRFCLARPDIFKTQLRAMLRASIHGNLRIMFPMISGIEELRQVKTIVNEVRLELDQKNIEYNPTIQVGSMIEVPSAVALADLLAEECDFFSLGTNDLIQYLLAVDRVNEKIAHLYQPTHPAVLRMIHTAAEAARAAGISCSICGEMAGDPLYTELLLGLGISSLSMAPVSIPLVRSGIGRISFKEAQAFAVQVLQMPTATEIKELITQRYQLREEAGENGSDACVNPILE
ncbi:MAG TPA: phosphoenolpyruvate--protein phosphotransferase [Candidatus Hydrogenedentes bacterium]|nr:phosphoenolpyruvate--protein phosphotransferase [Candidatus Hydrogenedentota bacterium]